MGIGQGECVRFSEYHQQFVPELKRGNAFTTLQKRHHPILVGVSYAGQSRRPEKNTELANDSIDR